MSIPKQYDEPDFKDLRQYIKDNIKSIEEWGRPESKDFEHYVMEIALTAMYGEEIWPWLCKNWVE